MEVKIIGVKKNCELIHTEPYWGGPRHSTYIDQKMINERNEAVNKLSFPCIMIDTGDKDAAYKRILQDENGNRWSETYFDTENMSSIITNEKYYYLRDKNNQPRITICILGDGGKYYRGIAICSVKDQFRKVTGRKLAYLRALRAMMNNGKNHQYLPILREEALDVIDAIDEVSNEFPVTILKSNDDVDLTSLEKKILKLDSEEQR
jgi:hypothetical protein